MFYNFQSLNMTKIFRTFITTPILCNVLGIHDCMLAIIGGLSTVASDITIVSNIQLFHPIYIWLKDRVENDYLIM